VVTVRIIETVFLALGIKVAARRFEIRAFAFRDLVEVDGVLSGRKVM
jgi:hypothetical protein